MCPKEKADNQKNSDDKKFVRHILKGDQQAWSDFVNLYTDWVFYTAYQWTKRSCSALDWQAKRVMVNPKTGKKYAYPEETHDVYIWLFKQLQIKLKFYTGDFKVSLSEYVWTVLHSHNFFVDFLRWKYGDPRKIPKALQDAPAEQQQVFVLMRMRKGIEQIAAEVKISIAEAEEIAESVLEKLIKAGLQDMVVTPIAQELKEEVMNVTSKPAKSNTEDYMLLYKVWVEYLNS